MALFIIISSQCKVVLCSYVHVFVYFDVCVCSHVLCSYICGFNYRVCMCEVFYGVDVFVCLDFRCLLCVFKCVCSYRNMYMFDYGFVQSYVCVFR